MTGYVGGFAVCGMYYRVCTGLDFQTISKPPCSCPNDLGQGSQAGKGIHYFTQHIPSFLVHNNVLRNITESRTSFPIQRQLCDEIPWFAPSTGEILMVDWHPPGTIGTFGYSPHCSLIVEDLLLWIGKQNIWLWVSSLDCEVHLIFKNREVKSSGEPAPPPQFHGSNMANDQQLWKARWQPPPLCGPSPASDALRGFANLLT